MPTMNLGRVRGYDGGFGNVTCEYVDDGGEPDIIIEKSGDDTAKDFLFIFKNIVSQPLSQSEINDITNDIVVNSSKSVTGTGLSFFFSRLKEKFAAKDHKHSAADITSGTLDIARIADKSIIAAKYDDKSVGAAALADNCVGRANLESSLRDSISHTVKALVTSSDRRTPELMWITTDETGLCIQTLDGSTWRIDNVRKLS